VNLKEETMNKVLQKPADTMGKQKNMAYSQKKA
jgi:hypothetical protein